MTIGKYPTFCSKLKQPCYCTGKDSEVAQAISVLQLEPVLAIASRYTGNKTSPLSRILAYLLSIEDIN